VTLAAGWKGRAVVRGTAAALLFVLTGCSATTTPPGEVAEQPVQGVQPRQAAPPADRQIAADVPVRSAVLGELDRNDAEPPVRVEIPSLAIDLPVEPVGVQDDGWMAIPENPSVVGWYRFGPAPGDEAGAAVLAAHVDSLRYGLGPFAALKTLERGAEVLVTDEGGGTVRYRVEDIERTGKAALTDAGVFDRGGEPRLNLITCGGTFDRQSRTYSDNVIVTAIPVA
jgi:LPXTG-site transpeptidase (sortase) family protein